MTVKNRAARARLTGGNLALYFFFFLVGIVAATKAEAELYPSSAAEESTITVTF